MTNVLGDFGQDRSSFLPIVLSSQPPGRFIAQQQTEEQAECRERLHGQRHLPSSVCLVEGLEVLIGSLRDEYSQKKLN
jgi:hypothetical protein